MSSPKLGKAMKSFFRDPPGGEEDKVCPEYEIAGNVECIVLASEQSGSNITLGYTGKLETPALPLTEPYYSRGLCPVNVHWHLGSEQ